MACCLAAGVSAQAPGDSKAIDVSKVERKNLAPVSKEILKVMLPRPVEATLANGVTVLILEDHRFRTVTVDLIAPGTQYGPRTNELDMNLKKNFRFGRMRLSPGLDVFNILNRSDVIAINTRYGPSWLQPTNIL